MLWPPVGKFLHVSSCYVEGTKMMGLSLDSLHSDIVDPDALRAWTHTLSAAFSHESKDGQMGPRPEFHSKFLEDLRCFCVYVASLDGPVDIRIINAINEIIDDNGLNNKNVTGIEQYTHTNNWTCWYPESFQFLVFGEW